MSTLAEKLKKRRREEQEIRGYANSSRWYTGLSNAISFLERAETATDPLSRFSDAWAVAYNLFMMHGEPGDEEFRRFNSWISSVKDSPGVRHYFVTTGDPLILAFRQAVERVKNILLKPQGLQELQSWAGKGVSPEKACRYFFTITRDIRNTAFHPGFNPTAPVKKAIGAAADCLLPIVAAAVEATIEHPVPHTTGKATAYRFFLYPFLKNSDGFFSDYYLERLFPDEELGAFPEDQSKELFKQISKQSDAKGASLQTADGEGTLSDWLDPVLFSVLGINAISGVRVVTEDAVFQPNLVLPKAGASGHKAGAELKGKDAGKSLSCMIWTLPWRVSLDSVATEPPFASLPITEVVHRALAASEVPWAIITNGRQLRLLSRVSSHKPRCFLEADLVALIDRRADPQAVRAFRFVLGLFSGRCFTEVDAAAQSLLDRVAQGSDRHGKEIGDELKANVFSALQELGEGFLDYLRANPTATSEWRDRRAPGMSREKFLTSDLLLDDIYHESLSLMYRLLFLFYAESRELLPLDNELYQTYSLEAIRDDVHSVQDDPDPKRFYAKGNSDLWARLKELFGFLDKGWGKVIPPYNGGLFDPEKHEFLEKCAVGDYYLARAIDLLSRTKPRIGQNRGEGRKKVTYRDLDVRHLGSIYEGILEYTAHIADQEYVILREGSGASATELYLAVAGLNRDQRSQFAAWREAASENPENPRPPRGCKVTGNVEAGQYYLAFGGRESKRKSSGSYYTPDYIVQFIVENTLGPLVRGECRPKHEPITNELKEVGWTKPAQTTGPLTSQEILDLKVLDPAMGSGHFLVAVVEYLARSYRDALLREGRLPDETKADQEFIRYKRIVAERCVYGVDLNSMAVELSKLSLWLFTMDPGRPLSFLDHNLRCGNSLIGARISALGSPGKIAEPQGRQLRQFNLFEEQFSATLPAMLGDILHILSKETIDKADIDDKKTRDAAIEQLKEPYKNVADAWISILLGHSVPDYLTLISNVQRYGANARQRQVSQLHPFHWELEYPEVFFDKRGRRSEDPGFAAVVTNPPYIGEQDHRELFAAPRLLHSAVACPRMDFWFFFASVAMDLVRSTGTVGMITTAYWLGADGAARLRSKLFSNYPPSLLLNFAHFQVFEEAPGQHNTVFVLQPASGLVRTCEVTCSNDAIEPESLLSRVRNQMKLGEEYWELPGIARGYQGHPSNLSKDGSRVSMPSKASQSVQGTSSGWRRLSDVAEFRQGIVPNPDTVTSQNLPGLEQFGSGTYIRGEGIYLLRDDEIRSMKWTASEKTLLVPAFRNSDIRPFWVDYPQDLKLLYITSNEDINAYPNVKAHLQRFKTLLLKRREVEKGVIKWYSLHWPRDRSVYLSSRLVVANWGNKWQPFALDEGYGFERRDVTTVLLKKAAEVDYWVLLGILNSRPLQTVLSSGAQMGYQRQSAMADFPIPSAAGILAVAGKLRTLVKEIRTACIKRSIVNPDESLSAEMDHLNTLVARAYGIE